MSKIAELLEENKREKLLVVDVCSECNYKIRLNESYYDIKGKILCEDCINIYKKKEEIKFE